MPENSAMKGSAVRVPRVTTILFKQPAAKDSIAFGHHMFSAAALADVPSRAGIERARDPHKQHRTLNLQNPWRQQATRPQQHSVVSIVASAEPA